jgi:hypothetical protein
MKRAIKVVMTLVMGFVFAASLMSCASTGSASKRSGPGFLGNYAQKLEPGPKGGAKMRWLKPGVDFSKYKKVILEHVVFFLDDTSQYKGIDTAEMNELAQKCDLALVNALKDGYPIVTEPGPDVVRIRMAITDLKQSNPTLSGISTVTMVTPIGLGVNLIKKGATGTWTGSGATASELMALDSMSGEVIAVAQDNKSAGFTKRYGKFDSVEEAFKFWGERLRKFLDETKSATGGTKQ